MAIFELEIDTLQSTYAICQLSDGVAMPTRPAETEFWSLTQTLDEVSLVCEVAHAPNASKSDIGWKIFRVAGAMELDEVGVLVRLLAPLRDAGISIFAISTFDTDYVLVREARFEEAVALVRTAVAEG